VVVVVVVVEGELISGIKHLGSFPSKQWRTQEFCPRGIQQIQLRTERTGIWGR